MLAPAAPEGKPRLIAKLFFPGSSCCGLAQGQGKNLWISLKAGSWHTVIIFSRGLPERHQLD